MVKLLLHKELQGERFNCHPCLLSFPKTEDKHNCSRTYHCTIIPKKNISLRVISHLREKEKMACHKQN
jgi:hypothetical protein